MEISVRPNLIAVWLRTDLILTDTMVTGTAPNTALGVLPVGRTNISQPLNRVSRVQTSSHLSIISLLIALLLIWLGVLLGNSLSIVCWLVALLFLAGSYRITLDITDSGGGNQKVAVSPLDRQRVQDFANAINQRLATQS